MLLKRNLVIMWLCFMTPVNVHVLNGFTMAELSKPILFDNMKPLKDVFSLLESIQNVAKYGSYVSAHNDLIATFDQNSDKVCLLC